MTPLMSSFPFEPEDVEQCFQHEQRQQKGRQPLLGISENIESASKQGSSKTLIQRFEVADMLFYKVKELQTRSKFSANHSWRLLFHFYGSEKRIPRQLITLDEKYIYHCLGMMHVNAVRTATDSLSSQMGILYNSLGSRENLKGSKYDSPKSSFTLTAGKDSVTISAMEDDIIGSVTASKSMINILGSPLLKQFHNSDSNVNIGQDGLVDTKVCESSHFESSPGGSNSKEGECSEFVSSCGGSTVTSFRKESNDDIGIEDEGYGREPIHERIISMTSSKSTFSDQSLSVSSNNICQAMLHCTWKNGFPQYIFSIDDQRDVYAANLHKVVSPDDQGLDYVYAFHLRPGHKLDYEIAGKMKVSTSVTLCPNNSEMAETQFVLFGSNDNCPGEMHASNGTVVKNKALRRKLSRVFHSDKRKTLSKISRASSIFEGTPWNPSDELYNNFDPGGLNLIESDYIPNLELAAMIVKDHLPASDSKPKSGGWGLNFLKNSETSSIMPSYHSECGASKHSECSTSINILVPAGIHGGPRTQNGGPSSLTERFRSGGRCDCGGWDIGCPLTVLSPGPNGANISRQDDTPGECKTFDLFVEGSKQSLPTMKMTNIYDGLYYIDFQSVLSALQVFSIATAIIHSRSPSLKHKVYRNR